ncbi:molecular chaperone DnaJ [Acinetobacter sp. YH16032]|uniref:molecular chaperone DnaJ n=1 Tax=Acinetobacter sp. YH16032 TaxID=2601181 RepID=UPI0015D23451
MTSFEIQSSSSAQLVQDHKLRVLINQIEQQKLQLSAWQHAQEEIRTYTQKKLILVYRDVYQVLFQQLQSLWNSLSQIDLNKSSQKVVEEKCFSLTQMLSKSNMLNETQLETVEKLHIYFEQVFAQPRNKQDKKNNFESSQAPDAHVEQNDSTIDDDSLWDKAQYQQARQQAKLKRQQDKQAEAEKLVNQSLKTVYLKIASIIHPDREPDESKKAEKTELLQRANEANEQEDLFYLLKLQLEVEQSKNGSNKGLTAEQVKFYQQALEAQSQALKKQIQELIDSLVWSNKAKIAVRKSKGQLNITDLYKQIDADVSAVKQQLKAEKQRLNFMGKESGLEMLLEQGVL